MLAVTVSQTPSLSTPLSGTAALAKIDILLANVETIVKAVNVFAIFSFLHLPIFFFSINFYNLSSSPLHKANIPRKKRVSNPFILIGL